jgi:cysteine dioxygenase
MIERAMSHFHASDHSHSSGDRAMAKTLDELFSKLDRYSERVPIDALVHELEELDLDVESLARFAVFDEQRYRRNVVHTGPGYQALLLCWRSGQRSPIHDHRGSSCGVRVLRGTLTETIFDRTPAGQIFPTTTQTLRQGDVCGSEDSDIHQISNLQGDGEDLITLHVYSPALHVMGAYSLTDSTVREVVDPVFEFAMGAGI